MKLKAKNESGRSMVEILGVLAIIGILSIGGILMYANSMSKTKANEIANAANIAFVSMGLGQKPEEEALKAPGAEIQVEGIGDEDNAYLLVHTEDAAVCKHLKALYDGNKEFAFVGDCE